MLSGTKHVDDLRKASGDVLSSTEVISEVRSIFELISYSNSWSLYDVVNAKQVHSRKHIGG